MIIHPEQHIIKQLFAYWKHWGKVRSDKSSFAMVDNSVRDSTTIERYNTLLETNNSIFKNIETQIAPLISMKNIGEYVSTGAHNNPHQYSFNLSYLKRDWSFQRDTEKEISRICEQVSVSLHSTSLKKKRVLFLGAATGRLAYELGQQYEEVYAVDNEITMGYLYSTLKNTDIPFADFSLRNQPDLNSISIMNASTRNCKVNELDKIRYILADVQQLPFAGKFFDDVISIYFSDVLPLKKVLPEISRVLKNGGSFIHYGPLEYHFTEPEFAYSLREFKTCLTNYCFRITEESASLDAHCGNNETSHKVFTNWMIASTKHDIDLSNRYLFVRSNPNLKLTKSTHIDHEYIETFSYTAVTQEGITHILSESIYDFLMVVRKGCYVHELPVLLENFGYENISEEVLLEYLRKSMMTSMVQIQENILYENHEKI